MRQDGAEIARREYREVEKPLFKLIRKAYGFKGFQVANDAMDDTKALLQRKVAKAGGWQPGMQTEVAQMIAHAYLHEPGKPGSTDAGFVASGRAVRVAVNGLRRLAAGLSAPAMGPGRSTRRLGKACGAR